MCFFLVFCFNYIYASFSRLIISFRGEKADFSAIDYS